MSKDIILYLQIYVNTSYDIFYDDDDFFFADFADSCGNVNGRGLLRTGRGLVIVSYKWRQGCLGEGSAAGFGQQSPPQTPTTAPKDMNHLALGNRKLTTSNQR